MKPRTNENEQWEAHGGHCAQPQAHKGKQAHSTGWSGIPQKTPDATGQSLKGFCRHSILLIETTRKEMQIQMQSIRDLWVVRDTTVTKRKPHSVCRNKPAGIIACTTQDYRRRADPQWGRCAQHLYGPSTRRSVNGSPSFRTFHALNDTTTSCLILELFSKRNGKIFVYSS